MNKFVILLLAASIIGPGSALAASCSQDTQNDSSRNQTVERRSQYRNPSMTGSTQYVKGKVNTQRSGDNGSCPFSNNNGGQSSQDRDRGNRNDRNNQGTTSCSANNCQGAEGDRNHSNCSGCSSCQGQNNERGKSSQRGTNDRGDVNERSRRDHDDRGNVNDRSRRDDNNRNYSGNRENYRGTNNDQNSGNVGENSTMEQQILDATNQERNGNLRDLERNSKLDAIASARLADMFANGYFSHTSPSGKDVKALAKTEGYSWRYIGENLAQGNFSNGDAIVDGWMNSSGHRANIMSSEYQQIGIAAGQGQLNGRNVYMAVQVFGTAR